MTADDRVAAALAAKTTKAACTVWIGACNTHGYGVVQIDGVVHTPAPPDRPPPVSQAARRAG